MKLQDRLFQKSVAGKSRHIPAGYNRRVLDTLNSLPDNVPCVSEETTVHVITHKINYKYITAVSAAVLMMISSGVCLYFGLSTGEDPNNNDPKTTVKVTSVTTLVHNGIVTEPSVTSETLLPQTSNKITGLQNKNVTQNHDIAGDPDQINKNNASGNVNQSDSAKDKNEAAVTEAKKADKVQNTKAPAQKEPSAQGGAAVVTTVTEPAVPSVTVPAPDLPGGKKDDDEKEDKKDKHPNKKDEFWNNAPFGKPDPAGKGSSEELPDPEHFIGGNNVQSKEADLQENAQKEAERIQREIKKAEEAAEKIHEKPAPYLPCVPDCENEPQYPQD